MCRIRERWPSRTRRSTSAGFTPSLATKLPSISFISLIVFLWSVRTISRVCNSSKMSSTSMTSSVSALIFVIPPSPSSSLKSFRHLVARSCYALLSVRRPRSASGSQATHNTANRPLKKLEELKLLGNLVWVKHLYAAGRNAAREVVNRGDRVSSPLLQVPESRLVDIQGIILFECGPAGDICWCWAKWRFCFALVRLHH